MCISGSPGWLPWSLTGETDSQVVETQKLGFLRREGGGGGCVHLAKLRAPAITEHPSSQLHTSGD